MSVRNEKTLLSARDLYFEGYSLAKISKKLKVHRRTLTDWKKNFKWEEGKTKAAEKMSEDINTRIIEEQLNISQKAQTELLLRLEEQEKVRATIDNLRKAWDSLVQKGDVKKKDIQTFTRAMSLAQGQLLNEQTLFKIMVHGLEIIRPKTVAQYNFLRQDNNNNNLLVKVNIPTNVKEMLNELKILDYTEAETTENSGV